MRINLAQALKLKNKLITNLNQLKEIFRRENSRRNDNTSTVDRQQTFNTLKDVQGQLIILKAKIAAANTPIQELIYRLAELKGEIDYLKTLNTRHGEEIVSLHNGTLKYSWDALFKQEDVDKLIYVVTEAIDDTQANIDAFNANTFIEV